MLTPSQWTIVGQNISNLPRRERSEDVMCQDKAPGIGRRVRVVGQNRGNYAAHLQANSKVELNSVSLVKPLAQLWIASTCNQKA